MDTSNLKEGQVYKNYKELCEVLGEKVKSSNSKSAQISMWESYFKFHKEGHKIIIDSIFDEPKGKMSRYGFVNDIEELILDLLVQDENNGQVFLSKNQLFYLLKLVNKNYNFSKYHIPKLSLLTQIDEKEIHEFFNYSRDSMVRSVETALRSLAGKSLVYWSSALTVCKIEIQTNKNLNGIKASKNFSGYDDYGVEKYEYAIQGGAYKKYMEATKEETEAILKTERMIMNQLNCENKQDIIRKNLWNEFSEQVKKNIFETHNIIYYYDSYKIITNRDYIYELWEDLKYFELSDVTKDRKFNNLNLNNKHRLLTNAIKRHEKETENEKYLYRKNVNYITNNENLIDKLIDLRSLDLKNEIKKLKK